MEAARASTPPTRWPWESVDTPEDWTRHWLHIRTDEMSGEDTNRPPSSLSRCLARSQSYQGRVAGTCHKPYFCRTTGTSAVSCAGCHSPTPLHSFSTFHPSSRCLLLAEPLRQFLPPFSVTFRRANFCQPHPSDRSSTQQVKQVLVPRLSHTPCWPDSSCRHPAPTAHPCVEHLRESASSPPWLCPAAPCCTLARCPVSSAPPQPGCRSRPANSSHTPAPTSPLSP